MDKRELIIFWKHRIEMLQSVLEDINMWNIKLFMQQIFPLRYTDVNKYWQMIEAWYKKIQNRESISNETELV